MAYCCRPPLKPNQPTFGRQVNAIGNGSTATAVVGTYSWSWKNKKGTSASLTKMVIDSLVAFDASEAEEAEEEVL